MYYTPMTKAAMIFTIPITPAYIPSLWVNTTKRTYRFLPLKTQYYLR